MTHCVTIIIIHYFIHVDVNFDKYEHFELPILEKNANKANIYMLV